MKSKRLSLRKIVAEDIELIYRGLSHPEVIRYYGIQYDSLEATREQMEWFRKLEEERKGKWWAVCSADEQTFYGAGGLNDWQQQHRKAELGFWLLPAHWGKGYMREAVPMICDYAFDQMGIHRIEGMVESENRNCKRAIEKLGFVLEGRMRDCERKNDTFISLDVYSRLRSDR